MAHIFTNAIGYVISAVMSFVMFDMFCVLVGGYRTRYLKILDYTPINPGSDIARGAQRRCYKSATEYSESLRGLACVGICQSEVPPCSILRDRGPSYTGVEEAKRPNSSLDGNSRD